MATFTWTATTPGGATSWTNTAAWFDSADSINPDSASFTMAPGNDYLIDSQNLFTIGDIGAGGTASPDTANSLTMTGEAAKLVMAPGGALDVATTLTLDSLLNLGTTTASKSVLTMGSVASGGTIVLGSTGRLEGAQSDSIADGGSSPTEITGGGTVIAESGIFQFGTSVQVAAGDTTQFVIDPNATLAFADAVSGGTIVFTAASGSGVLDVGALSTFDAPVKGLFVSTLENDMMSGFDFLNVGTNASATLTNVTSSGATVNIFTNTGSQTISIIGNYVGNYVNYESDGNGGTLVFLDTMPCYASGTTILTPDGAAAVETIQRGDRVMIAANETLEPSTVVWTGYREIDMRRHPSPEKVAPIRFRKDCLGLDQPHRDLLLSPDHCLFIDGGLYPAKLLVNDMTIVRDLSLESIRYHHIELERHAVMIAEGVPAESYLDTGNRAFFDNAGLAAVLHPEFNINAHARCWATDACAPLRTDPGAVKPIWDRITARAIALGFTPPEHGTTEDPSIHLVVDGKPMPPLSPINDKVCFVLPRAARSIRLMSRSVRPADLRPWLDDPRRLGIAVRSIALRDRDGETVLGSDHPALTQGWHAAERDGDGASWRWTKGSATLPIVADGPCVIEIQISETTTYRQEVAAG